MNKKFTLISTMLSFWVCPIFFWTPHQSLAQENTAESSSTNIFSNKITTQQTDLESTELYNSLSTEQKLQFFQNQGSGTQSNLFQSSKDDEKAKYFKNLNEEDKLTYIRGLSSADQNKYFNELSSENQMKYFMALSYDKQIVFFQQLDSDLKIKIFKSLDKSERSRLFEGLNKYEQSELLESLTTEETSTEIEAILSGQFPKDIDEHLAQYGYSFFTKGSTTFEPLTNVPVGSDYIIGPGDSFTIYLWGGAEESYKVTVSRDGDIIIPRIGTINVSGLTFTELKNFLGQKFKKYFNEFQMNITMDTLRAIEIFLVGEVKNPGTYSVGSLSTIVTALYATGGPTKNGSLRNIKLIRNGETITILDLYDFFIKGIKDNDARLEQGDTIFIPVIAPVVGISGYVKRPAIYETKGSQTIADIIDLSGGVLPVSYLQSVIVERITDHQKRIVRSFNLDPNNKQTDENLRTPVQDGDLIKIYPVNETLHQVVYLEGHVKYPREYEFKEGMKVRDIIPSFGYLLNEPYLPIAEIVRLMPPDLHPETIKFNLDALMSGDETQNLVLQDQDRLIIYNKWDKKDRPKVTINGDVRNPGTYNLVDSMTIKDLIFSAGNLSDKAYLDNADLTRFIEGKDNTESLTMKFSVAKALQGDPENNLSLQADDIVNIRTIPSYSQALERKIYLEGEFLFPGEYSFSEGERLSSVISRAGGLTKDAYTFGAIFQRESVKEVEKIRYKEYTLQVEKDIASLNALAASSAMDQEDLAAIQSQLSERRKLIEQLRETDPTGRMVVDLDKILSSSSSDFDFKLRSGDRLIVSKRQNFVAVMGEVYNPTALLFEDRGNVKYYLNKVGGMTKTADKNNIYIVKANGTVISKQQGGYFNSIKLDPGDTVIVPQKLKTVNWLKGISNVTSIVYQLALAAAVVHDYIVP
jgi:protein involved in polysaccharide export with SLBB domain